MKLGFLTACMPERSLEEIEEKDAADAVRAAEGRIAHVHACGTAGDGLEFLREAL